ncbi:DUF4431 domain-containing protein [Providencia rettgeri]|uniref:DUF4431 domain-containing protein n=1 Tax=Providencia hangzhouensis TaxID=3031799 RepID=UPI0025A6D563|nr:DUF4431 domain-containing protein [Providencia rettgeri]
MFKKLAIGLLLVPALANAASFDCAKEPSKVGKLICNTPELSKMDDELYVDYLQAKLVTGNNDEFRKLVKQNWKLRQDNCETVECISDWYKRSTILYRNIAGNGSAISSPKECYKEGQQVSLSGELRKTVFPGAPNYESVELGDKPETYWVLNTENSLSCVTGAANWGRKDQFQLIVDGDFYNKNSELLDQNVLVTGNLVYSMTGHHHTPVMIRVQSIKMNGKKIKKSDSRYDSYGLPLPKDQEAFKNFEVVVISVIDNVEKQSLKTNSAINVNNLSGVTSSLSTSELYAEYKKNELVANNKYKGKKIRVFGTVESVTEDLFGNALVKSTSPDFFLGGTMFYVDRNDPYVLNMVPNASVDMVCVGGGFIMDSPILRDCTPTKDISIKSKSNGFDGLKKVMPYVVYMGSENMIENQCKTITGCMKYKEFADAAFAASQNKTQEDEKRMIKYMNDLNITEETVKQVKDNMDVFMNKYEKELQRKYGNN